TAGVKLTPKGHAQVNERLETTAEGVFAVGDCAGSPTVFHRIHSFHKERKKKQKRKATTTASSFGSLLLARNTYKGGAKRNPGYQKATGGRALERAPEGLPVGPGQTGSPPPRPGLGSIPLLPQGSASGRCHSLHPGLRIRRPFGTRIGT